MAVFRAEVDLGKMRLPHPRTELADMLMRLSREIQGGAVSGELVTLHSDKVGSWSITSKVDPMSEEAQAVLAKPLGVRQRDVLQSLVNEGYWHPGCGWLYNTDKTMLQVLNALQEKGLAQCVHVAQQRYEPTELAFEVQRRLNPGVEASAISVSTEMAVALGLGALKRDMQAQIEAVSDMPGTERLITSAKAMIARLDEMTPEV